MKQTKTKIRKIQVDISKRLLFMSDIHGDLNLFKEALKTVNFSDSDELFIIGDFIEKGNLGFNLATVRYMMELSKKENVHVLAGNCDQVVKFLTKGLDKEKFFYYALEKRNSILNDIAFETNTLLSRSMDVDSFIDMMHLKYKDIYDFIDSLDDVIFVNNQLVLVHGGIEDIQNIPDDKLSVLKKDNFLSLAPRQPMPMLVGHYPTRIYCKDKVCVNPIFDFTKNIISIDGGNQIAEGGQLNVVVLNNLKSLDFSFIAVDHYPKYCMEVDVIAEEQEEITSISFGDNEIDVLSSNQDFVFIKTLVGKKKLWVPKSFIYEHQGRKWCYDGTNYFLNLKKGDLISIIKLGTPYVFAKCNGVVGLVETKYIDESKISYH